MEKLMNEAGIYINYLEKETPNEDQDPTIAMFDKLWNEGWITGDPVVVAREMGVDPAYLDSFIQWYVELNDLEYTPWILKYQNNFQELPEDELEILEDLVSSTNPYREAPKKKGFSPEYIAAMKLEDGEPYFEEDPFEESDPDRILGEFLPDWFEHHDSLSKSEWEEMRVFHENNPQ